jgi:hypothetical protein
MTGSGKFVEVQATAEHRRLTIHAIDWPHDPRVAAFVNRSMPERASSHGDGLL